MHARVGASILERWEASGARSLFVVGTGKNVGKTVTMRAIYRALIARGTRVGLASIGRDGEAIDIGDGGEKPRLWLEPGTVIATARAVLPASPACEVIDLPPFVTAVGALAYARVRHSAYHELIGPPTASAVRSVVEALLGIVPRVLVDGAIDRIAALAGGDDAIVIACGAAAAPTMHEAIGSMRALAMRLRTPACDPSEERIAIDGALTASRIAELMRAKESRAIVVRDPTQIAVSGRAAIAAFERLRIRCERPLRVIAATVNSFARDRAFEPRAFARAVAEATGLPVFDVYAAERAA
jgi:hypothetical protein